MGLKHYFLALAAFGLVSCGGGSAASGSGFIGGTPSAPSTPVTITVSSTAISFTAQQNGVAPAQQTVEVTWADSRINNVVGRFPAGQTQPDWLRVTRAASASPVTFNFDIAQTDLTPGDYTASLTVAAQDNNNQDLVTETINITYQVSAASPAPGGAAARADQDNVYHFGQTIVQNGANVAWSAGTGNWFNNEIGTTDAMGQPRTNIPAFQAHFETIANAGGNSARIWLHTGATTTPVIEAGGTVTGLSRELTNEQVVSQMDAILDAAWAEGILVTFNVFSFNMICDTYQPQAAKQMLEANFQTYIDNALTPMVTGVKDHPAMFAWDIFNEAEGMSQINYFCPSSETVSTETVQQVVNRAAAAIHALDPNVKVTTSVHTDIFDRYSNAALTSIPNADPNGTLDFYSVHWYDTGWLVSPHITTEADFMADRPIIVGEYDPDDTGATGPTAQASIRNLIETGGYGGALPWSLTTGNVPGITSAINEAASLSGPVDRAAIEDCLLNRPASCYTP